MILLSRSALNSPRDLSLENDRVFWSDGQNDGWVIGDNRVAKSVSALFETLDRPSPNAIPEEYARSMEEIARGHVPWPLVIPQGILGDHLRSISSTIDDVLEILDDYAPVLARSRRVLSKVRPCRVDLVALRVEQEHLAH